MSIFPAWLTRKPCKSWSNASGSGTGQRQRRETGAVPTSPPAGPDRDPKTKEEDGLPPPYSWTLQDSAERIVPEMGRRTEANQTLDAIRARVGMPRLELLVPPHVANHRDSPTDAAFSAGSIAIIGACDALYDPNPCMVVARTLNAVAVAAATSAAHPYLAFVAAVTAAEGVALLCQEQKRDGISRERFHELMDNAFYAAVDTAMEAAARESARAAGPTDRV